MLGYYGIGLGHAGQVIPLSSHPPGNSWLLVLPDAELESAGVLDFVLKLSSLGFCGIRLGL